MQLLTTGWYLFPTKNESTENYIYNVGATPFYPDRSRSAKNEWWFADASLLVKTTCNFFAIVGVRYDFFTTRFNNPFNSWIAGPERES